MGLGVQSGKERERARCVRPQWQLDSGGTVPGGAPLQQHDSDATTWGHCAEAGRFRGGAERQLWAGPQGARWPDLLITEPDRLRLLLTWFPLGEGLIRHPRDTPLVRARSNWVVASWLMATWPVHEASSCLVQLVSGVGVTCMTRHSAEKGRRGPAHPAALQCALVSRILSRRPVPFRPSHGCMPPLLCYSRRHLTITNWSWRFLLKSIYEAT